MYSRKRFLAGAKAAAGGINLSGTFGSPVTAAHLATGGADAVQTWLFAGRDVAPNSIVKGQTQEAGYNDGSLAIYTSVNTGTDWAIPNDFQDGPYYFRANSSSGDPPNIGNALDTWISVANGVNDVFWGWRATGATETYGGIIRVRIATDSGGTNIIATGYYQGTATNEP